MIMAPSSPKPPGWVAEPPAKAKPPARALRVTELGWYLLRIYLALALISVPAAVAGYVVGRAL